MIEETRKQAKNFCLLAARGRRHEKSEKNTLLLEKTKHFFSKK
jgi:hypothetical protein